ncbi:hypothetical protein [Methylocystis iwaonis]|uniref:hypothetical protein n=1 Tax=Methylocystis iwaonis TaxID=2885079 RepID=UPI002492DC45|nr:hypothetical protein [Methylocystis iwaonis]
MRRYLIFPLQFDTRAHALEQVPQDPQLAEQLDRGRESLIANLKVELGENNFEEKLQNFRELGSSPFSVIAHHNVLFHQARYAFIHGFYYPALTASCALGERILNHLFLDLREHFPQSTFDRKSHTRRSIDDWTKAIETLHEWRIFQAEEVKATFEELRNLRHRSLHFNASTVETLKEDARLALAYLATIIEKQFGFQFPRTIPGSKGAFFFKKDAESDPFIRRYYLPQCPRVSPFYTMLPFKEGWLVFDRKADPNVEFSDEKFVSIFGARTPDQLAPSTVPWSGEISVVALTQAGVMSVDYTKTG